LKRYSEVSIPGLSGDSSLSLKGNYFIINAEEQTYYHFMVDQIGQFLYLKSAIPNLKLLIIEQEPGTHSSEYATWCLEKIKANYEHTSIKLSDYGHIDIENITVISNRLFNFYHLIDNDLKDLLQDNEYLSLVIPHLRHFFLSNISKNDDNRLDIFVSRDGKAEEVNEVYDKIMSSGGPKTLDDLEKTSRYLTEEEYELIKSEFKDFVVLDYRETSFQEQLEAVANAKRLVVFVGASVANAFIVREDCEVFLINTDTAWPLPNYHDAMDMVSPNVHHLLDYREYPNTRNINLIIQKIRSIASAS